MGFLHGLLNDDEELLAEMRPHPVLLVAPVAVLLVALAGAVTIAVRFPNAPIEVAWLLAAMVVLPALWLLGRVLQWRGVRFVVTSSRLIYRRGVFGRDVVQLRLQRVAEVHLRQTLRGRVIGYGQLVFEVLGGDGPLVVDDVRRPRSLQRLITAQLDRLDLPRRAVTAVPRPDVAGGAAPGAWAFAPGTTEWEPAAAPSAARRRSWSDTPPSGVPVRAPTAGSPDRAASVPEQLFQLDELRRRGILSDAEFAAKKAELLSRL